MGNLTRFRRYVRDRVNVCEDMKELLDVTDKLYEGLEQYDETLRHDSSVNEEELLKFMNERASALIEVLANLIGLWPDAIDILVKRYGVHCIETRLELAKNQQGEPDTLTDLDDHPF